MSTLKRTNNKSSSIDMTPQDSNDAKQLKSLSTGVSLDAHYSRSPAFDLGTKRIKIEDMDSIDEDNHIFHMAAERFKKRLDDNDEDNAKNLNKPSSGKSNVKAKGITIDITLLRVSVGGSSMIAGMVFTNAWHLKEFLKGEEDIDGKWNPFGKGFAFYKTPATLDMYCNKNNIPTKNLHLTVSSKGAWFVPALFAEHKKQVNAQKAASSLLQMLNHEIDGLKLPDGNVLQLVLKEDHVSEDMETVFLKMAAEAEENRIKLNT